MKYVKILFYVYVATAFVAPLAFSQSAESSTPTPTPLSPYALYQQGKYRAAIREAEIIIQQDRQSFGAYAVKGWAHLSLRQWNEALKTAQTAYAINPSDSRIVQILGEAYYELGKYNEALKYFERYLGIAPRGQLKGWVYYFVGMIYFKQEKLAKADISLSAAVQHEKARGNTPRVSWVLALASIKEKRERLEEALATYRYVLSIEANNATARKAIIRLNS